MQSLLPAQMLPATIRKSNPEDQPILWLALTSDGRVSREELMRYARNVLQDQFSTVDGVGDIALGGYVDANLRVWLSAPRLRSLELTASDVIKAIEAEHVDKPAGRIENDLTEANVRLLGQALTPAEFGKILVSQRGGGTNFIPVPLSRVARVEEGLADVRRLSRLNGKTAVGLGILKQHGSNAVEVAKRLRQRLAEVRQTLPPGTELSVRIDQTKFIQDSVDELSFTLLFSALLTAVVCFLFLGSWSSTFNVLLSIPTSIVGAFIVLHFFGFTLNTFTLLGLSLAIGIVVDDSIMMLENIVRHGEMGKPRVLAALDGAREITFSAVAATIAVVAIFLPVIFMDGVVGRYLYHYGITVTAAVMLSLLEGLTLTPMRCSRFLAIGQDKNWLERTMDRLMDGLAHIYTAVLRHLLRWPLLVVVVSLGVFAGSLSLIKLLPSEMIPAQDQSMFILRLTAPVGSSMGFTDGAFRKAEADINTDYQVSTPEFRMTPDREKAAAYGVSMATISSEINALIGGAILNSGTQYPKDNQRYNINVRLEADQRTKEADLHQLSVRNNRGELVPLDTVVKTVQKPSLQQVSRHNRARAIPVYANIAPGHNQKEALAAVEAICKDLLPPGYAVRLTGTAQTFKETIQSLFVALVLGIFVSYMVLSSQFNSFIHPVTVLMALPFSISGAFVGLYLTHQSINMFSMIGIILLMGIVKKNSILLIDFTNQKRHGDGLNAKEALIFACPVRLRPIMMTSLATIAGSLPAALVLGPGAETRVPMAVAIIGGVFMSTALTLLVVPCVYQLLARFERRPV